jgi:glycosyltransferase involved in cell wall biosynthesis
MSSNKRTVLLVMTRFEFGGVPIQTFLWAKFLKENNFRPIILGLRLRDDRYCDMLRAHGLEYALLKLERKGREITGNLRYFQSLIRALRSFQPYAIFPFNKILSYNINLIRRFTGASKCYFMERNDGSEKVTTSWGEFLRKLSMMNADAMIFNSDAAAHRSAYKGKKIVIKNSFVNPRNEQEGIPAADRLPDDKIILLHIANFGVIKNYDLLLDSWPELFGSFPDCRLVVIGAETTKSDLAMLKKLEQPGIIYLHRQPKVSYFIKRADVCLLSSFNEGCSNTMLEYMFYNKLICASNIPALREMVAEETYPFLFDNSSKQDFIEKVKNAITLNRESAEKIKRANHMKLLNDYSDKNYYKILDLL